MDIRLAQALQSYGVARQVPKPEAQITSAAKAFSETLGQSEAVAMQAMTGGADPHALVEALANNQLAVETAVTVRDRVVEAYQEILRMSV